MNDSLLVGVVQRLGRRRNQFRRFRHGRPVRLDSLRQGAAFDELGDDEAGEVLGAAHVVDGHDVGMVEIGDGAGFGQVGFGVFGSGDEVGVRHLDGDEPLQLLVLRQIDEAETALSQHSFDAVATDPLRRLGGDLVQIYRRLRKRLVGFVHGLFPSCRVVRRQRRIIAAVR